ncbi:MAG TPA: hydrogenase small subunit, partial [Coriobacteriia bacterium]
MAQEVRDGIQDLLAARGVSRRDFMKYCGSVAALLGLSEMYAPQIASAVEGKLTPAVWFNLGSCTGCTESMAQVGNPDVATVVLDLLSVDYFETVMAAAGKQAEENEDSMIEKGGFVLIVEGTVMTGQGGNTLRIAGKTGNEHLEKLAAKAAAILAVGSCAVDGGWVAAAPNPAEGMGVGAYLASKGIKTPVINLPTCPVNPTWVVAMVVDVKLLGELASGAILGKLDDKGRPKLIFGSTIHDNCPRRG